MSGRNARRYDDDYPRGSAPQRRAVDEPSSREDRHREQRSDAREKPRYAEEPIRAERAVRRERPGERPERDDPMDYSTDSRGPARGDPRANQAVRRPEPEPQRETIQAYRDPRTGQLRDVRTGELIDTAARPVARQREYDDDRMMMDRDDQPPPQAARRRDPYAGDARDVRDARDPRDARDVRDPRDSRDNRDARGLAREDPYDDYGRGAARAGGHPMNDYFVDGSGIEREVLQHDLCRYLGNDATMRRYRKDVCRSWPWLLL